MFYLRLLAVVNTVLCAFVPEPQFYYVFPMAVALHAGLVFYDHQQREEES